MGIYPTNNKKVKIKYCFGCISAPLNWKFLKDLKFTKKSIIFIGDDNSRKIIPFYYNYFLK